MAAMLEPPPEIRMTMDWDVVCIGLGLSQAPSAKGKTGRSRKMSPVGQIKKNGRAKKQEFALDLNRID
jgi:hypothetical protein